MLRATLTAQLVQHDLAHAQTCGMLWDGMGWSLGRNLYPLFSVLPLMPLYLPYICPVSARTARRNSRG